MLPFCSWPPLLLGCRSVCEDQLSCPEAAAACSTCWSGSLRGRLLRLRCLWCCLPSTLGRSPVMVELVSKPRECWELILAGPCISAGRWKAACWPQLCAAGHSEVPSWPDNLCKRAGGGHDGVGIHMVGCCPSHPASRSRQCCLAASPEIAVSPQPCTVGMMQQAGCPATACSAHLSAWLMWVGPSGNVWFSSPREPCLALGPLSAGWEPGGWLGPSPRAWWDPWFRLAGC